MNDEAICQSCTMPIETGPYCAHCADAEGNLIAFEECFARMVQWTLRHDSSLSRDDAERQTYRFMSERPAWSAHPRVVAALEGMAR